jgi:hypothetical protein
MFGLEQKDLLIYGGAGLGGLIVLAILLKALGGSKRKRHLDLQKGLREKLDNFPDAPPLPAGHRRLVIDGVDVRLRLVVVAPAGNQNSVEMEEIPELLDDLMRGLAAFVKSDKPRVRVWPAQLSVAGFAPTFFRLVESPDDEGVRSQWIRVAGPIKIGGKPYLLGLALYAEEVNKLGSLDLEATQWSRRLQIEK